MERTKEKKQNVIYGVPGQKIKPNHDDINPKMNNDDNLCLKRNEEAFE